MSAFKKSLLVAGVAMILSNNVFADEGHGIVKFKGEVISALTAVKHGNCSSLTPLLNPVRTRKSLIWP
ncbi:fimbrial protein [Shigella sonnei]|nr:fimbrial protein [Shigella sonnei]